MSNLSERPTVSVLIPTFNEEAHIDATLDSVAAQTYENIIEVLVIDGRSTDRTRQIVAERGDAKVLDNPRRMQAAALNAGIEESSGDVVVRVDGHCLLDSQYVEQCVDALSSTGAAMVGGAMTPVAHGAKQQGIAQAMASRIGAGPARFHVGGRPGWVDTVYLGAYRTEVARAVGGYRTDVGVNEDSEFAIRMGQHGGVWFEPQIRSTYEPRATYQALARQFWRYGLSRAATVKQHPRALAPRQLAAPALVIGLASPWRRRVALLYAGVVAAESVRVGRRADVAESAAFSAALPLMHLSWGLGFLAGLSGVAAPPRPRNPIESAAGPR